MTYNIPSAYLKNPDSGVFTLSFTGEAKERIDNIVININNLNEATFHYEEWNYRWNNQKSTFHDFTFNPKEDNDYYSQYKIEEVLPEYIETKTQIYKKGFLFTKMISRDYKIVKNGLIRLNFPIKKRTVRCNNWKIEIPTLDQTAYEKIQYNPQVL